MRSIRSLSFGLCLTAFAAAVPAVAQIYAPPSGIPGGNYGGAPQGGAAAQALRIDRLENRVRELTGQIEQLQFQLRRTEQQLQKFQSEIDYRLQEGGGRQPQRRGGIEPPRPGAAAPAPGENPGTLGQQTGIQPRIIEAAPEAGRSGAGRTGGDAFDPQQNPAAPGAPRPLAGAPGPYTPSAPRALSRGPLDTGDPEGMDEPDPHAPLDLSGRGGRTPAQALPQPDADAGALPGVQPAVPGQSAASLQPRDRYRVALAALKEQRYDEAEYELQTFLKENPKSKLAPDAYFNLGLAYEKRGRHREAAEQYLKITQQYDKSHRASESMLRLGLALERLGAREQACATWQEAGRKYPLAPGSVRVSLERQIKRAKC